MFFFITTSKYYFLTETYGSENELDIFKAIESLSF